MATKNNKSNSRIVWSNYDLNLDDWIDDIKERLDECGVDYSEWEEYKFHEEMLDLNDMYFKDEICNLDISTEGRIIEIADVGLWNGRRTGYNLLNEYNIKACLNFKSGCEYAEWWIDEADDLRSKQTHHDSHHEILYREIRSNMSSDQIDNFCWKIYNGQVTRRDINRYTVSLGERIRKVYGWSKSSLIGFKNGKMEVIGEDFEYNEKAYNEYKEGKRKNYLPRFICKCECGNIWKIFKTSLQGKSCPTCCPECAKIKRADSIKKWKETEEGQKIVQKSIEALNKKAKERKKTNSYDLSGDWAVVTNDKGEEFWVDKEDVDKIKDYYWFYNPEGYVIATGKNGKRIRLHRLIMDVLDNPTVDVNHKKHPPRKEKKVDNRKENLEVVSRSINNMNCALGLNNKSGITGVCWDNTKKGWRAYLTINRKRKELGVFKEKEKAIQVRKEAEIKYFGEHRYDALNT